MCLGRREERGERITIMQMKESNLGKGNVLRSKSCSQPRDVIRQLCTVISMSIYSVSSDHYFFEGFGSRGGCEVLADGEGSV